MASEAIRLWLRRFHRYAGLGTLLNLPILIGDFYLHPAMLGMLQGGTVAATFLRPYFTLLGGWLLIAVLASTLFQTVLIHGAWHELRGERVGVGAMLSRGLARWPAAMGFTVLLYILLCIGAVMLVFPAVVFLVMAFVALPACVVERAGPFRSLSRSIDLTEGYRWKVLVILLATLVVTIGGAFAIERLLGQISTASLLVRFVWQSLALSLDAVLSAATYLDLRIAKEGGEVERLAAVFD